MKCRARSVFIAAAGTLALMTGCVVEEEIDLNVSQAELFVPSACEDPSVIDDDEQRGIDCDGDGVVDFDREAFRELCPTPVKVTEEVERNGEIRERFVGIDCDGNPETIELVPFHPGCTPGEELTRRDGTTAICPEPKEPRDSGDQDEPDESDRSRS